MYQNQNAATNQSKAPVMPPMPTMPEQQETTAKSKTPYSDATRLDKVNQAELLKTFNFTETEIERIIFKDDLLSGKSIIEIMDYALELSTFEDWHQDLPDYRLRSVVPHMLACYGINPDMGNVIIGLALAEHPEHQEHPEQLIDVSSIIKEKRDRYRNLILTPDQMFFCVDFIIKLDEQNRSMENPVLVSDELKKQWIQETSEQNKLDEIEIEDLMTPITKLIKFALSKDNEKRIPNPDAEEGYDVEYPLIRGVYPARTLNWLKDNNLTFQFVELMNKKSEALMKIQELMHNTH